eukprot:gene26709-32812_t
MCCVDFDSNCAGRVAAAIRYAACSVKGCLKLEPMSEAGMKMYKRTDWSALALLPKPRKENTLLPQPASPKYKLCHVGFTAPGGPEFNTDKDKNGYRYDAVPICNGVINAGAYCDLIQYDADKHDEFAAKLESYDAFIVRVNPGQLS